MSVFSKSIFALFLGFVLLGSVQARLMLTEMEPVVSDVELSARQTANVNRVAQVNAEAAAYLESFYRDLLNAVESIKQEQIELKDLLDNGDITQGSYDNTIRIRIANFRDMLPYALETFKTEFRAILRNEKVIYHYYTSAFGSYKEIKITESGAGHLKITGTLREEGEVDLDFQLSPMERVNLEQKILETPVTAVVIPEDPNLLREGIEFVEVYRDGQKIRHKDDLSQMSDLVRFVDEIIE